VLQAPGREKSYETVPAAAPAGGDDCRNPALLAPVHLLGDRAPLLARHL